MKKSTTTTHPQQHTFTRQAFYDRIWSIPAEHFARELGISEGRLRQVCKAHHIPKPYPGYWSKRRNKQTPHQTALPINDDPDRQTITFQSKQAAPRPTKPAPSEYDDDIQRLLNTATNLPRLVVPDTLTDAHPLVVSAEQTHRNDRESFTDRQFNGFKGYNNALALDVSPPQLDRALRIMEAIIRRVEHIGGRVELQAEQGERPRIHTVVVFGKEPIATIRVRETYKKIPIPPPTDGSWLSRRSEIIPTGLFVLDRGPSVNLSPHLKDVAGKHRIEDNLHDWLIGLIHKVAEVRHKRRLEKAAREHEKEQRRRQAQQEKAERQARNHFNSRQREASRQQDKLLADATDWHKSRLIRDYLAAFAQAIEQGKALLPMNQCTDAYLKWAHAQADRLDPFTLSPRSVLDEVYEPGAPVGQRTLGFNAMIG